MANCSQINNTTIKGTSAVIYDSTPLPCTDIKTCDDLNTILAKFDSVICSAVASVAALKEEVTNITEDVMIIIEDIININDQLNICCPNCNFTGTANELLVCDFTGSANEILNCEFTGTAIQPPVPTTTTTTTIAPTTTTTTTTILNCDFEGNAIITVPPATTTTTTTTLPSPVAITMIVFGTETEPSACASIITNLDLRTTRYSTSSYLDAGETIYNGPGLTNPTTGPIATYYGYIVPGPLYAWAYVGTDGVVISSGYCS